MRHLFYVWLDALVVIFSFILLLPIVALIFIIDRILLSFNCVIVSIDHGASLKIVNLTHLNSFVRAFPTGVYGLYYVKGIRTRYQPFGMFQLIEMEQESYTQYKNFIINSKVNTYIDKL